MVRDEGKKRASKKKDEGVSLARPSLPRAWNRLCGTWVKSNYSGTSIVIVVATGHENQALY